LDIPLTLFCMPFFALLHANQRNMLRYRTKAGLLGAILIFQFQPKFTHVSWNYTLYITFQHYRPIWKIRHMQWWSRRKIGIFSSKIKLRQPSWILNCTNILRSLPVAYKSLRQISYNPSTFVTYIARTREVCRRVLAWRRPTHNIPCVHSYGGHIKQTHLKLTYLYRCMFNMCLFNAAYHLIFSNHSGIGCNFYLYEYQETLYFLCISLCIKLCIQFMDSIGNINYFIYLIVAHLALKRLCLRFSCFKFLVVSSKSQH
jgi:hypothetical protein